MRVLFVLLVLSVALVGCKPKSDTPPPSSDASPGMVDREWVLVSLGDDASPLGNGGKPVTLRLESGGQRAAGNAGCNRFSGPYTLSSDGLSFGPAISTKMACDQGMDVEMAFLEMLPKVATYRVEGLNLELLDSGGATLARFRAS